MRYRGRANRTIPDADALTRQDVARIRGAAAVAVIPGMEGLARMEGTTAQRGASEHAPGVRVPLSPPVRKAKKVKRA